MSSQEILSRELALRIGLAARAMPDTDAKSLLAALSNCVSLPITEKKIAALDLNTLKKVFLNIDDSVLTQALIILKKTETKPALPDIQSYQDGDMPGSVRIACATDNGIDVNGHFGACANFMIYQVSAEEVRLVDIRSAQIPQGLIVDDKNVFRAEQLQDCQVLYMASVGGPAAAKIVKLGIHPIKLDEVAGISNIIMQLQRVIAGTPPPWLAKAMGKESVDRFRYGQEATG